MSLLALATRLQGVATTPSVTQKVGASYPMITHTHWNWTFTLLHAECRHGQYSAQEL